MKIKNRAMNIVQMLGKKEMYKLSNSRTWK